jgi:hypothetical protein
MGGQVCASESCGSSHDAQPNTYMQETNDKAQMANQAHRPKDKDRISIVIGILRFGICSGDYKNLEGKYEDNT